ncbi:MAG: M15 family metallopeptidase [Ilumatobacteraceae bacterium]
MRAGRLALAALAALAAGGWVVSAGSISRIDGPATASVGASPVFTGTPASVITVNDVGAIDTEVVLAASALVRSTGGEVGLGRSAMLGMVRVTRGGVPVLNAPSGLRYPMSVSALPEHAVIALMGPGVSSGLDAGRMVMGETSAGLHGIVAGDVVELIAFNGSVVSLAVSSVVPDSVVRGTEILVDLDAAGRLGMSRDTYVIGWNVDRGAFQAGYLAGPLANRRETKVRRSWDAPDPDSTLSTARVKQQLGIPAYVVRGDGTVGIDDGWVAANLPGERLLLNESIRIRARCHNGVNDALRAALAEIAASGRAAAVNVTNSNRYGGCFQARFNRIAGDIGILSRHTWGMALDINTADNCQGCRPVLDCDVVRTFRRHGFAWGGTFTRPDGMHFEWVGEPRDQLEYPSLYCPNIVTAPPPADPVDDAVDLDPGGDGGGEVSEASLPGTEAEMLHLPDATIWALR